MNFVLGGMNLVFDLQPGVYSAWSDSGMGKTYTAKLLRSLEQIPNSGVLVLSYDYVRNCTEEDLCDKIIAGGYRLIFADRGDLYVTPKVYRALCASNAIVYLDTKNNNYDWQVCGLDCDISFTDTEIRYYVDTF